MGSDRQTANFGIARLAKIDWRFGQSTKIGGRSFSMILYPARTVRSDHIPIDNRLPVFSGREFSSTLRIDSYPKGLAA